MNKMTPETVWSIMESAMNNTNNKFPYENASYEEKQIMTRLCYKINEYIFNESMKEVISE